MKKKNSEISPQIFWVFLESVLLSAHPERFSDSSTWDFHRIGPLVPFSHRVCLSVCLFAPPQKPIFGGQNNIWLIANFGLGWHYISSFFPKKMFSSPKKWFFPPKKNLFSTHFLFSFLTDFFLPPPNFFCQALQKINLERDKRKEEKEYLYIKLYGICANIQVTLAFCFHKPFFSSSSGVYRLSNKS